jgi:potassium channel subfamily K protein 1
LSIVPANSLSFPYLSDGELEAFIVEIVKASERGVSAIQNVSSEPNWGFGQSLFFAGTILTTIGAYITLKNEQKHKLVHAINRSLEVPV